MGPDGVCNHYPSAQTVRVPFHQFIRKVDENLKTQRVSHTANVSQDCHKQVWLHYPLASMAIGGPKIHRGKESWLSTFIVTGFTVVFQCLCIYLRREKWRAKAVNKLQSGIQTCCYIPVRLMFFPPATCPAKPIFFVDVCMPTQVSVYVCVREFRASPDYCARYNPSWGVECEGQDRNQAGEGGWVRHALSKTCFPLQ